MAQSWYAPPPFFGPTGERVRGWRRQTSERRVVKLPEGVQSAMAAGRLAPHACRPLHDAPAPRCSGEARRALRAGLAPSRVLPPLPLRPGHANGQASVRPQRPLRHPRLQDARSCTPPPVWPPLPAPPRPPGHDRRAPRRTARGPGAQRTAQSPAYAEASDASAPPRLRLWAPGPPPARPLPPRAATASVGLSGPRPRLGLGAGRQPRCGRRAPWARHAHEAIIC